MALVSHMNKFIYIKNRKVAGTSVESFFGKYCCDPTLDYTYTHEMDESVTEFGIMTRRMKGKSDKWDNPHIQAHEILNIVGEDVFNEYYKFCVVRNPWDRLISAHYWLLRHTPISNSVLKDNFKKYNIDNWSVFTINNIPICDYYIRYENLESDIIKLCGILNIKDYDIKNLPKHKRQARSKNDTYHKYYDKELQDMVYQKCKPEIDYFNYKF